MTVDLRLNLKCIPWRNCTGSRQWAWASEGSGTAGPRAAWGSAGPYRDYLYARTSLQCRFKNSKKEYIWLNSDWVISGCQSWWRHPSQGSTSSAQDCKMSPQILSPKSYQKFPRFLQKNSPFWRPQVGIESVSKMANILLFLIPKSSQFQRPFLSPFPIPFVSPFPIPFLSPFPIPFYTRFRYTVYRCFLYTFYPCFWSQFPIHFLSQFLFLPLPGPFLPQPPMQPCAHVWYPVPNVRIGHKSD